MRKNSTAWLARFVANPTTKAIVACMGTFRTFYPLVKPIYKAFVSCRSHGKGKRGEVDCMIKENTRNGAYEFAWLSI